MHDGDQGIFDDWLEQGFGVIAPSRPGYGRSDLLATPEESADQYAALLDALDIKKVAGVFGISGGGPSTCLFAARHGDRAGCLILEVAITSNFHAPDEAEMYKKTTEWGMTSISMARANMSGGPVKMIPQILAFTWSETDAEKIQEHTEEIKMDPRRMKYMDICVTSNNEVASYPHHFKTMCHEIPTWK